jgi:hypothetical protein
VPDQPQKLQLSFTGEAPTDATGLVHEWTTMERARRAAMGLALMWGLAGVSRFIPVIDRFLVPAFLLLGPVFAVFQFTEARRLISVQGRCPRCKVDREFALELRFNGPRSFTCDACKSLIEIRLSTNESAAK